MCNLGKLTNSILWNISFQKSEIERKHYIYTMIQKLVTPEDPYHIHKTCGLYVLMNFIYQYYLFFTTLTMNLTPLILLPHALLHVSSFMFKVLSHRGRTKALNMFIWDELRLHSCIFAFRAIFTILFPEFGKPIVVITMLCADYATKLYGTEGVGTVRGKIANHGKRNIMNELSVAFFSISQMGATVICAGCFQSSPSPYLTFFTLPAIQTSAFGMTLIRKNIIDRSMWSVSYTIILLLVYVAWYKLYGTFESVIYPTIIYLCRRYIRFTWFNKYILWGCVFFIDVYLKT